MKKTTFICIILLFSAVSCKEVEKTVKTAEKNISSLSFTTNTKNIKKKADKLRGKAKNTISSLKKWTIK